MKKFLLIALVSMFAYSVNAAPADTTSLTVQVGAGSKFAPINIVDKVTGNYVSATITNVTVQNNNPELATIIPNPSDPTSIKATAVTAGNGTAVVSCHITYVDPGDGLHKSEDKSITITYTVIAAAHGVRMAVTFN